MSESMLAARRAWVRAPHCAFHTYIEDGKHRFHLVARSHSPQHFEFDPRVTIALRDENLDPLSDSVRYSLRVDAITTRAVAAMPGMGFAEFLEQVS